LKQNRTCTFKFGSSTITITITSSKILPGEEKEEKQRHPGFATKPEPPHTKTAPKKKNSKKPLPLFPNTLILAAPAPELSVMVAPDSTLKTSGLQAAPRRPHPPVHHRPKT
jgi:hypothetical protein